MTMQPSTGADHSRPGPDHGEGAGAHIHAPIDRPPSRWARLFGRHAHSRQSLPIDPALWSERGIWAVKVSLAALMLTALFQVGIVAISGSVALLADTVHNFSDALTSLPLWLAFSLSRRAPNRRFAYGYGRAEDIAGAFIVLMIVASAILVLLESLDAMPTLIDVTVHVDPSELRAGEESPAASSG